MAEAEIKWFTEAKLNIAKNCIDRHLNKRGDKTAIIFEPNDPSEEALHFL
jgi:acetyl-CoA synthetase